jgi:uncharacterized integral membrane protein
MQQSLVGKDIRTGEIMSEEPRTPDPGDPLDRCIAKLKVVWLALFSSGLTITLILLVLVLTNDAQPAVELGDIGYLFLVVVPFGLLAAFFLAPLIAPRDPARVLEEVRRRKLPGYDGCETARPGEAMYWYPVYAARCTLRLGFLEGATILCALGFFMTANWAVLGGAAVMLVAMLAVIPSRAAAVDFAESARLQHPEG